MTTIMTELERMNFRDYDIGEALRRARSRDRREGFSPKTGKFSFEEDEDSARRRTAAVAWTLSIFANAVAFALIDAAVWSRISWMF